ncbi:MAG: chemotaxis protein CheC [Candidatus Riflebacteria bacterium]|nr:chemotaxis protein CheC [Candidatus Riflebacteria bacterium]
MDNVLNITREQLDALREIGNIGSGNAASALAQFLNRKIDMSVPNASIMDLNDIPMIVGGPNTPLLGIFLKIMGEISGRFLLLIPESTSIKILKTLMPGFEINSLTKMGEMESSCMREIGNILAGAFLNALSVLTQTPMLNSLPSLNFDYAGAMIDNVVADMTAVSDKVLMMETSFIEEQEDMKIHIFILPAPDSLKLLLQKIGVAE